MVNFSGGIIGDNFDADSGSVVNISGGIFGDNFDVNSGSVVNFLGTEFFIDGIELDLLPGQAFTIIDRDVTLSGLLDNGELFSFDLNSTNTFPNDFFSPDSTITVTSTVPEPSSAAFITLVLAMGLARRRRG